MPTMYHGRNGMKVGNMMLGRVVLISFVCGLPYISAGNQSVPCSEARPFVPTNISVACSVFTNCLHGCDLLSNTTVYAVFQGDADISAYRQTSEDVRGVAQSQVYFAASVPWETKLIEKAKDLNPSLVVVSLTNDCSMIRGNPYFWIRQDNLFKLTSRMMFSLSGGERIPMHCLPSPRNVMEEVIAKPPANLVGSRVSRDRGRAGRASLPGFATASEDYEYTIVVLDKTFEYAYKWNAVNVILIDPIHDNPLKLKGKIEEAKKYKVNLIVKCSWQDADALSELNAKVVSINPYNASAFADFTIAVLGEALRHIKDEERRLFDRGLE